MEGRIELMGMPVDVVSEAQAVATVMGSLDAGRGGAVITPHLEMLRRFRREPSVRPLFHEADLVVADGMPLVWASRVQGTPLPERVPGSELVWSIAAECALRDRSLYLLGGDPGACEAAERSLRDAYPGLRLAGFHRPPLGFERDPDAMAEIRARLRAARPDVVFVALGFPKQEHLIRALRDELPATWFLGVGVSLSFVGGQVARSPDWAMRLGLEWLHRLGQEPRRLFRRYVVHGLPFAARLFAHAAVARLRGPGRASVPPDRPPTAPRVVFHHGAVERSRIRELAAVLEREDDRPDP